MIDCVRIVEEHYSKYLGNPSQSQQIAPGTRSVPILRLQEYANVPSQGAVAIVTLGLCSALSHTLHEELLFLCYAQFANETLYSLLASVAEEVATSQHPLHRGEVLLLARPLPDTEIEALYIYPPVYLPEGFEPITIEDQPAIHIAWLIPIYASEAGWISRMSSKPFEDLLQSADPDLMNLHRASLV